MIILKRLAWLLSGVLFFLMAVRAPLFASLKTYDETPSYTELPFHPVGKRPVLRTPNTDALSNVDQPVDFIDIFKGQTSGIGKQLKRYGWLSPNFLYQISNLGVKKISFNTFLVYLNKVFSSSIGREFKYVYDQCSENACDITQLRTAARAYYFEAAGYTSLNSDEYTLVGFLSGESRAALKHNSHINYDDCKQGQYYDGYGLDELRRKSLETYLSAYHIDTSYVCFSQNLPSKTPLKQLSFAWYSREEVPQSLAIYGVEKKAGQDHDVLIKQFNPRQSSNLIEINDYVVSELSLNLHQSYDRYKIKLLQGGQQNRLLLRGLNPVFESNLNIASDGPNELLQLAHEISHQKPYGTGVQKISPQIACTSKAIIDYMNTQSNLHCGNFAYLFINELPKQYQAKVFVLKAFDGRVHVVVQVDKKDEKVVVDPTTGLLYPCNLASLVDGSCSYEAVQSLTSTHPALLIYAGKGFFYGAEIIGTYHSTEEMTQSHC
ncbi:MAG: hypothetical protein P1U61_06910 [Legionellaceae bacterium]|nr:hypothetical protein [Legionellaceae bacterium]